MTDTSKCFPLVRGRAMRVTRLDACGNRVLGPLSTVVSDGFVSVSLTAQTEEGESISVTNAAGAVCVSDVPAPKFTGYDVAISFCNVNPDLYNLVTNQPVVYDDAGTQGVGFEVNDDVDLDGSGFALELWSNVPTTSCADTGVASYGYFLIPFLKGGIIGDITVENAAINFSLSGAKSKSGTPWGVGPYNVVWDSSNQPSKLNVAVPTTNHLHLELTQVAPPTTVCGAIALGVPATTAVAGIPATLSPANSYAPANFASISGLVASPLTAWTVGQYVLLRDGTKAHWTSSAWATGPA